MSEGAERSANAALSRFARDLTAEARQGRLEPVRCREHEIARVIDILLRQGKNNPALVGPAGVGKTAIAEGLAQRLVGGDVPLALRKTQLLAVDHVALLAGTTYRGQYEERIRLLVEETRADPRIVLFIDELHNLIGQGTAMGAAMDAANMLKPALVRGDFRVIGATTDEEYERWICSDSALERRFQRVLVRELSASETLDILNARHKRLEQHHNVLITDEAIRAAVTLTDLHQTDRRRPDRAIDALDEACAHAHAVTRYSPETESLIVRRKVLLRSAAAAPRPATAAVTEDDPLDDFARSGMAALQRFGAELEAMFTGMPEPEPVVSPRNGAAPTTETSDANGTDDADAARRVRDESQSLAEVDARLSEALMREGAVVRGVDVARVVAVSTGREVTWVSA